MHTLPHTRGAVLRRYCLEGRLDLPVDVEPRLVHEVVEPPAVEAGLHLREHRLDRVELGAVPDVEHRCDVELWVLWPDLLRFVDLQLVHEQGKGCVTLLSA